MTATKQTVISMSISDQLVRSGSSYGKIEREISEASKWPLIAAFFSGSSVVAATLVLISQSLQATNQGRMDSLAEVIFALPIAATGLAVIAAYIFMARTRVLEAAISDLSEIDGLIGHGEKKSARLAVLRSKIKAKTTTRD